MSPKKVQVRTKFLRDYLAARGMYMLLFFEFDRWTTKTLEELALERQNEDKQEAQPRVRANGPGKRPVRPNRGLPRKLRWCPAPTRRWRRLR
jgi:hypothetical protein